MSTYNDCLSNVGYDITCAPRFYDLPYDQWIIRIKTYTRSMNFDLWNVIDNAYIPSNAKSKRNKNENVMFTMNKIVLGILRNSLDSHVLINCGNIL